MTLQKTGALIKAKREHGGLSQKDVARLAAIAEKTVIRLESGDGTIKASTLAAVARAIGIDPEVLENWEEHAAADHLRKIMASELISTNNIEDRIMTAIRWPPPEGYRMSAWQAADGSFHVEFVPEPASADASLDEVGDVERYEAPGRRRTGDG